MWGSGQVFDYQKHRGYLNKIYEPFAGNADLCAAFYRRSFDLLRPGGMAGLVATNSIGQGDTREAGLARVVHEGGTITSAHRFLKWSGDANVEVNLVAFCKGAWRGGSLLDNKSTVFISSRLDDEPEAEPSHLMQNEDKSFQGSIVLGMGFVLTPEQASHLIEKDSRNADCLYPYLTGQDVNGDPEQKPSRWVINFHDWELAKAQTYVDCLQVVQEKVKPERDRVNRATLRERWWRFADRRPKLYATIKSLKRVLVLSSVSSFHIMAFVPKDYVFSHSLVVFAFNDDYHFALLQSHVHQIWIQREASSLESRTRYTPTDCFDTFPFPQVVSPEAKQHAELIGATYYAHRSQIMRARSCGLTDTYNLFHDANCTDANIVQLRELHAEMDRAILACYSWHDLDLQHDFYQNERGQMRYTVSNPARREMLERLLGLNREIAAKEQGKEL